MRKPKKQTPAYASRKRKRKPVTDGEINLVMKEAKRTGDDDLYWRCWHKRLVRYKPKGKTPLEKDFNQIIFAYELMLRNRHAVYTWRKVKRVGIKAVLVDWALSRQRESGFKFVVNRGFYWLTGEYLVLEYWKEFPSYVVAAAYEKLLRAGVSPAALKPLVSNIKSTRPRFQV